MLVFRNRSRRFENTVTETYAKLNTVYTRNHGITIKRLRLDDD